MSKSYDIPIITISVKGGLIEDIEYHNQDFPNGLKIIIKDYDTDGSIGKLKVDKESGRRYSETKW